MAKLGGGQHPQNLVVEQGPRGLEDGGREGRDESNGPTFRRLHKDQLTIGKVVQASSQSTRTLLVP